MHNRQLVNIFSCSHFTLDNGRRRNGTMSASVIFWIELYEQSGHWHAPKIKTASRALPDRLDSRQKIAEVYQVGPSGSRESDSLVT